MTVSELQKQYTTVYDQALSDCGNYLSVGTNHGYISIFDTSKILSNKVNPKSEWEPKSIIKAHSSPIYSLLTFENLLVSSGRTDNKKYCLSCWKWSDLPSDDACSSVSSFSISEDGEINDMTIDKNGHVFAGCGDGVIRKIDLVTNKTIQVLEGHSESVLSICWKNDRLASVSEDGTLKLWDIANGKATDTIRPFEHVKNGTGKWLSSCDFSDDWIVCGGSVPISVWFLRNLSTPASTFDCDSVTHCIRTQDGIIHSGGDDGKLHEWSINGEHNRSIEVNAKDVYSIHHSTYLTVGGTNSQSQPHRSRRDTNDKIPIDLDPLKICMNNGVLKYYSDMTIKCICKENYVGDRCEYFRSCPTNNLNTTISPCHGKPCGNAGTCWSSGNTFKCECSFSPNSLQDEPCQENVLHSIQYLAHKQYEACDGKSYNTRRTSNFPNHFFQIPELKVLSVQKVFQLCAKESCSNGKKCQIHQSYESDFDAVNSCVDPKEDIRDCKGMSQIYI
ncbi:DgyrCDS8904 [Dimorphilus gyrociliatus]|uniref:DgyrCDS8904 n=1 Tax=Dimorphilus gyrociliatus TaxID=2664684 RepID=A0A7I8VVH5_9ANNE|nr:DgyrCDS8904 [Dimorphilus gyrociliatus]